MTEKPSAGGWLSQAPRVRAALQAVEAALARGCPAELGTFVGLTRAQVARWLYRRALEAEGGWHPYVELRPELAGDGALLGDSCKQAATGWLFVELGWQHLWSREQLQSAAASWRVRLLLAVEGDALPVPPQLARRIARQDRHHLCAVDPSIAHLRRALEAYCRAGGIVHLSGAPGTGRRALAHWAHARLDTGPLLRVRAGHGPPPPISAWELYEELGQLELGQLTRLRSRLHDDDRGDPHWDNAEEQPRPDDRAFAAIVGDSPALCRVLSKAARFGRSDLPLLIRGRTGTGKELLAHAVHEVSQRRGKFVAIDLSTRGENLIESALFGHVKGAFTGAQQARRGALVEADGGTLFLDELGNLGLATQAKLLRVLEYGEVQPLGADRPVRVEVRIVAATHADLEEMVRLGEFREDFLYRFNPHATLRMPSLKERREDILPLARHLLALSGSRQQLAADAEQLLLAWDWPGNVRELKHAIEAAAIESAGETITAAHFASIASAARSTPVLLTSSQTPEERQQTWKLSRAEVQRLTAVTLQIPPLTEREPRCVRSAVLGLLGGRPIAHEALAALERRPWWGNLPELHRVMAALCSNAPGPIDLAAVRAQLPDLAQRCSLAPIRSILFPALHNQRVVGLERVFLEKAVLVGRIRTLEEIEPQGRSAAMPRLQRRWQALSELFGDGRPGCLNLEFLGHLSRAHFVVRREDQGLSVHALPETLLPVFAGGLEDEGLYRVEPDAPVFVGDAGEIRVLQDKGGLYLHMLVLSGGLPLDAYDLHLKDRLEAPAAGRTIGAPRERLSHWQLSPREVELLVALVLDALEQRSFAGAVRKAARAWGEGDAQDCWQLALYLDSAHPTQSASRLFAYEPNGALRKALEAELAGRPEAREIWQRLPVVIQRVVSLPA